MTNSIHTLAGLFDQAVALDRSGRELFLERSCAGRPELRLQLERLLDAPEESGGGEDGGELPVFEPGRAIGRWQLLEPIGAGGLGMVYRAVCEADGVTLRAAVKVLRPGLDVLLRDRFREERAILAGLDHPYIARLIDAGIDEAGTSFLAVEFVEGLPLDVYLEQSPLPLAARLRLFIQICEAAGYLLSLGVVHGDLKPSNLIVRGDGLPKLLDFGTARLVRPGGSGAGAVTRLMMTPAYASPERLAGEGPSAASDVYALGCILAEMTGDGAAQPDPDLTAICGQCLHRSPAARYASPLDLAEDVERYLRRFPVRARAVSLPYRLRKFLSRNRLAVSLAALVFVSLAAGVVISSREAGQRRSVVDKLVPGSAAVSSSLDSPLVQQRVSYHAGIEDVIAQMESAASPPFAGLTSAWRRLSYSQSERGQTGQAVASIATSVRWARQWVRATPSMEARAQLADSLLYAALMHQRRGHFAQAGPLAMEAVQLVETLPEPARGQLARSLEFLHSLRPAARWSARRGSPDRGRVWLEWAVQLAQTRGQAEQLRLMLDLVQFERAAHQAQRAEAWCARARALPAAAGSTERRDALCGRAARGPGRLRLQPEEPREHQVAALEQEVVKTERRLMMDPEDYGERFQLARLHLRLARLAASGEHLDRARTLVAALTRSDPGNRRVQRLARLIGRGLSASPGHPGGAPAEE